ncbi:hypothetical protein RIF29_14463 [Crotalaria pallida]|uniref:Uncharacterized protein n=1 Tax=Crotalaria pallida TaxID=3830 RepID=A0AAN9ICS2_CROPI
MAAQHRSTATAWISSKEPVVHIAAMAAREPWRVGAREGDWDKSDRDECAWLGLVAARLLSKEGGERKTESNGGLVRELGGGDGSLEVGMSNMHNGKRRSTHGIESGSSRPSTLDSVQVGRAI